MLKRIIASTVMATATHTMRPSRSQRPRKEEVAGGEACALISPTPRPSSLVPSVTTPLYSTTVSQALRQTLQVGVLRELRRIPLPRTPVNKSGQASFEARSDYTRRCCRHLRLHWLLLLSVLARKLLGTVHNDHHYRHRAPQPSAQPG